MGTRSHDHHLSEWHPSMGTRSHDGVDAGDPAFLFYFQHIYLITNPTIISSPIFNTGWGSMLTPGKSKLAIDKLKQSAKTNQ